MNLHQYAFALLGVLLVLTGCSKPEGARYYPTLRDGLTYEYLIKSSRQRSGLHEGSFVVRINGTTKIKGKTYFKQITIVDSSRPDVEPLIQYVRQDKQGIYYINADDTTKTEYLQVPFPLKVGNTWAVTSPVGTTTYKAETIETLELYDRSYKDCLKVSFASSQSQGVYYLAPDIGTVKYVNKHGEVTSEYLLITK